LPRFNALASISDRLAAASEPEAIWQMALDECVRLLVADGGAWVWSSSESQIMLSESAADFESALWLSFVAQVSKCTESQVLTSVWADLPLHILAIPMQVGMWDGWLILISQHNIFEQSDLEFANVIVYIAHTAFLSWQRYEKMKRTYAHHVQELEGLRDIMCAIGRTDSPERFFQEIALRVAEVMDTHIAGVLLYDEAQSAFVARAPFVGIPDTWVQNYRIPVTQDNELGQYWSPERFYWMTDNAQSDSQVEAAGLASLAVALDVHPVLVVALETEREHIGFIQVASPKSKNSFTEDDARTLALLASQISGMVRISQLMERMTHRASHLDSLVSVATTIGTTLDLETVLKEIVTAVSGILHCQRTVIFEFDVVADALNLMAAEGVSERYWELSQKIPVESGARTHAVAANEMVVSEDVLLDPESLAVAPWAKDEGFRAFVDLPLRRGHEPIGLLSVQFIEPHHFTTDELNLLRILAEQAAAAIYNARPYTQTDDELRRRLAALEALQRVTREITATVDLDYILNEVLKEAIRFSVADAGLMAVFNAQAVEFRAYQGYDDAALTYFNTIASGSQPASPLAAFFAQPESIYKAEVSRLLHPEYYPPGAETLLIMPVFYEQRLVAAIALQSAEADAFSQATKEFVDELAVQTSIAIGNAQRYQEQLQHSALIHQRAEQMALLLEINRTMRSDRALEDILLDVAYAVQEGANFEIVLISVLDGNFLRRVAGAGIPLAELQRMKKVYHSWSRIEKLFQAEFCLGQCYYIPAEYAHLLDGLDTFIPEAQDVGRQPGKWHSLDTFIIPLRGSRGNIVGLMSIDKPMDGAVPTAHTAEVIELFAAQVSLAIENNRLVEDLRRQVDTLQLFNELNRSITTKLDLSLVLNTVVQAVTSLLNYDYATIYLQEAIGQRFVPLACSGYSLDLLGKTSFKIGEGLVGTVAQMGLPLVIEDTQSDCRFIPGPIPVGSAVMVPLTVEGCAVGVLAAERRQAGVFLPTDAATLTSLADQVAVAVENARLFDAVKRFSLELEERVAERTQALAETLEDLRFQRDRSEVLYHIASELVSSLDIDRILSQALLLLQKAVRASRSSVILLDNKSGQLIYRAAIGHTEPIPPGGRIAPFSADAGIVGWVLKHREPVVLPNIYESEWAASMTDALTHSILAVPIVGRAGEALGVILLQSPMIAAFETTGLRLVEAAAVQLGHALNNAELYHLIREQAERLGAMLRSQQIEAAKNQAILEGIADGVLVADANGRVTLFNAAAERILSLSRAQALGCFQDEILGLYGTAARDWLVQIEQWRKEPRSYGATEFLTHRMEVGRRVVSMHLAPVISSGHEFLGVVSVFRDITAEVEADRAKSEFVSTVSHELRTPMTSIVGYVDLLLAGVTGPLGEMQTNFLEKVKTNAGHLTNLVNDLLDISRLETGRVELQCAPVAIELLIESVIDLLRPKIEDKEQRIYAVIPDNLPKVYGDSARLTQILTNLVSNAYKYTPTGREIGLYPYVRDGCMHVAVVDNGIGIALENQQKIFDRFYRVEDDPAVYEVSGTGLGLAITLSLIQMHGGEIGLESELGKGSIFTFSVPLAEGEAGADVGNVPLGLAHDTPANQVLVVDGDVEFATVLQTALESNGCAVNIVASGEDALHIARKTLPDLIVLDARLPDLNGFEVLQLLKRVPVTADIPVIIVSVVQERERGLNLGAVEYLTKPVDIDNFITVVTRILEKRGPVLVVDNDKSVLDAVRSALQAYGVGVRTARSVDMTLKLLEDVQPALMLVDFALPDINSYQRLEQVKRNLTLVDIPLIVMSGQVMDTSDNQVALQKFGAVRFLTKPFSIENLARDISGLINGG